MNNEHMKQLKQYIDDHWENCQIRLPPHKMHPNGRNAIAHMWLSLKSSYNVEHVKDIPDKEFETCLEILKIVYQYAEDINVEKRFPKVNIIINSTLDQFFKND